MSDIPLKAAAPFSSATILKTRVQHSFHAGDVPSIDLNFALTALWTVLFGPSGSGKSTVLRTIAGLMRPQAGRVVLRGDLLTDTAQNIFVPAHRRGIGYVGQNSVLFPHLSVAENVAFGGTKESAERMLELFQAGHLAERRVQNLSGGERQRVLLARALAVSPRLLLLDEPFVGLDMSLRAELVQDLRRYLTIPVLSVTHDVSEVFALDADVIVLRAGQVRDQGNARSVLAEQRAMMLRMIQ